MAAAQGGPAHGRILTVTHLVDPQDADLDQAAMQAPHTSNYTPLIGDMVADDDAENVRAHYWDAAAPGRSATYILPCS